MDADALATPASRPRAAASLLLDAQEIAAMPPETALALGAHFDATGRPAEAALCALSTPFEDPARSRSSAHPYGGAYASHFHQAALLASRCAPGGVADLIDALESRAPSYPKPASSKLAAAQGLSIGCGRTFDALAKTDPKGALDFATRAPAWACIHWNSNSVDEGINFAMSGALAPDLLDAYLRRDGFSKLLARSSNPISNNCADIASWIKKTFASFDPAKDHARREPLAQLLSSCLPHIEPGVESDSPLPSRWVSELMLGRFHEGRRIVIDALGREACLAILAKEGSPDLDCWKVAERGPFEAARTCCEAFGTSTFILSRQHPHERSTIACLAKSMPIEDFEKTLDAMIADNGTQAILANCAHRFWAIYESGSSVRKMGDALAYCAAEGLMEQAQALLARFPTLERKSVKDVLAYMRKRDTEKNGHAHSAWESLVLREVAKPAFPLAPPRRPRL